MWVVICQQAVYLTNAPSTAADIIQVDSLDGIHNDSPRLHGDDFSQHVLEASCAVQEDVVVCREAHAFCPTANLQGQHQEVLGKNRQGDEDAVRRE